MEGRQSDHRNMNLAKLNIDIFSGNSGGKIIWQPRILCWYDDRIFSGGLPEPYTGMSRQELYKSLGCSNRIYDYTGCFEAVEDSRIRRYSKRLSKYEVEHVIETPAGKVSCIMQSNASNYGEYPKKWWITCEEDMKVFTWMQEHQDWRWNEETFWKVHEVWGDNGAPTVYFPRVNIQSLIVETMGVEESIYALYDYPEMVEKYFRAMSECQERLINVMNSQDLIRIINFGDNVHSGIVPPDLFKKYILPEYQKRNELLHRTGKFTNAHWDGDVKPLLQYAKETGLDGLEALTPEPQGDVTLEEMKKGLGDDIVLMDGIAAILFDEMFPEEQLVEQVNRVIELFAPKLVLGISDEMASTGSIERVKLVGRIVDDYNASVSR